MKTTICALFALTHVASTAQAVPDMPFELAFAHSAFAEGQPVAVSPDGKRVAYVVSVAPETLDREGINRLVVAEAATARATTISPQDGNCGWPSFSPDSGRLAFFCESETEAQLWIHERDGGATRRVPLSSEFRWSQPESPLWDPDGRRILVPVVRVSSAAARTGPSTNAWVRVYRAGAERRADARQDEDWARPVVSRSQRSSSSAAELAAVDITSGSVLSFSRAGVSTLSSTGRWLALTSSARKEAQYPWRAVKDLTVISLSGTSAERTSSLGEAFTLSGADSVWHPSREQLFWAREGTLQTAAVSAGAVAHTLVPDLTDVAGPLAITRDGRTLLVATYSKERSAYTSRIPLRLFAVPLSGGVPRELALPSGQAFLQAIMQRPGLLWQPTDHAVTVLTRQVEDGEAAILRFDLRSGNSNILWRGRAQIDFAGASADHSALFGIYQDIETPPDLYRFSADLSSRTRVSQVEPRFAGLRPARVETFQVSVPQYDGSRTPVTAALLLPAGARKGDRLPTLTVVYPRTTHIEEASRFGGGLPASIPASVLTTRGYAVLLTAVGLFPELKRGHLPNDLSDAVLAQVQGAAALGYTDIERVAIGGLSFGAFSAALIASATNVFRAGICIAGVYDLTYSATGHAGFLPGASPGASSALAFYYGMTEQPWMDLSRVMQSSPFFQADRIRTPLLILHTVEDGTPVEDARKMFNALRLLGRTAQYAEYSGAGHGLSGWSKQAAIDASRRIVSFMDEHVRAPARSTPQTSLRSSP